MNGNGSLLRNVLITFHFIPNEKNTLQPIEKLKYYSKNTCFIGIILLYTRNLKQSIALDISGSLKIRRETRLEEDDVAFGVSVAYRTFATGVACQQGTLTPSWHLIPSHSGLAYALLVETNPFPECVVIFPDCTSNTHWYFLVFACSNANLPCLSNGAANNTRILYTKSLALLDHVV